MNKKFSTLAASLMLASVFSANAQVQEALGSLEANATPTSGAYYHLAIDGNSVLTVIPDYTGQKDSLVIRDPQYANVFLGGDGEELTSKIEGGKTVFDAEDPFDVARSLWKVEKVGGNASSSATYKFTNKFTGNVMSFSGSGAAIIAAGTDAFDWQTKGTDAKPIQHIANKVHIIKKANGEIRISSTSPVVAEAANFKAMTPKHIALNAYMLNSFNGDNFKLNFGETYSNENPFANQLQAVDVTTVNRNKEAAETTGGVYLRVLNNTKFGDRVSYVVTDTTLVNYGSISSITGKNGIGYKFTTDTAYGIWDAESKKWVDNLTEVPADSYDTYAPEAGFWFPGDETSTLDPYKFNLYLDPATDGIGKLLIKVKTLVKAEDKTDNSYYQKATVYGGSVQGWTGDFVTVANLEGGVNHMVSSNKLNSNNFKAAAIKFAEGVGAVIDTKFAYFISDARNYKIEKADDAVRVSSNDKKGAYYVHDRCDSYLHTEAKNGFSWVTGEKSELVPATQWVVTGKDGRYTFYNRETGNKLTSVNNGTLSKAVYEVGENIYAIGKDTIKLEKVVVADGLHIGSAYFDKTAQKNMAFAIGVVDPNAPTKVLVAGKDNAIEIGLGTVDLGAQVFKLVDPMTTADAPVDGTAFKLSEELAEKNLDSLEYHVYYLQEQYGNRYLGHDNNAAYLTTVGNATPVRFVATGKEGQYKLEIFNKYRDYQLKKDAAADVAVSYTTTEMATTSTFSQTVVKADAKAGTWVYYDFMYAIEENEEESVYDKFLNQFKDDEGKTTPIYWREKNKLDAAIWDAFAATEPSWKLKSVYSSDYKFVASTTEAQLKNQDYCNSQMQDLFTIQTADRPVFAKLGVAHYNIKTPEDDTKAITMFNGFASLKSANQQMGDAPVTEENLGLWVAEANMKNEAMPMYYITTARGISKEDQEAGLKYHMISLKDSTKWDNKYNGKVKLGFALAYAKADTAIVFAPFAKADSIGVATSPATYAFKTTPVDGEYKILIPGLQQTAIKDKNENGIRGDQDDRNAFGEFEYEQIDDNNNFVAVYNNVLYLTDEAGAYVFTFTPTSKAPVANEGAEVNTVKVTADNGVVSVLNAAGKKVTISTVLGKIVANAVAASDNATFSVASGIVYVSVEGEEAVSVIVK